MLDTASVDEADVDALVEKEKPVAELVVPEGAVVLVTLKPALPEEAAELAGIAVEAVLAEEVTPNAGTEVDWVVLLDAGVETVVVVTVENRGAAEVVNEKVVFVAGVLETGPPEAAYPNPREDWVAEEAGVPNEKLEVLDEEDDVCEGAAEVTVVDVDGLANAEALENEKPEEAENGEAELELEVEPAGNGLESEGVVVAAEDEVDEPNKFEAGKEEETVVEEDETEEAPNTDDPELATNADDPKAAAPAPEPVADAPNGVVPEVVTPNKGALGLAAEDAPNSDETELAPADEDVDNKDEPELAPADEDDENNDEPELAPADEDDEKKDEPELAEGADEPNKDDADEP